MGRHLAGDGRAAPSASPVPLVAVACEEPAAGRWSRCAGVRVERVEQVSSAREFTRATLVSWGAEQVTDSATLVASELVTNALVHAHDAAVLTLRLGPGQVRVAVFDTDTAAVRPREASAEALGGRGLLLVDLLADDWGITADPTGKLVWAELAFAPPAPDAP